MDPSGKHVTRFENSQIVDAIGPVTTHWGLKLWRLLFLEDQVVAWPYSWKESGRIGLGNNADPILRAKEPAEAAFERGQAAPNFHQRAHKNIERQGRFRRHFHADIAKVTLRFTINRDLIEFTDLGGSRVTYGIYRRVYTDDYSKLLQRVYGDAFKRRDFSSTRLGKFLSVLKQ